jgi:DNA-binding transcriptional LysR family regulator
MGEITMTWFAGIFSDLRKKMPRISYEIELDLAFQLKQKLRQGDLDMAIVAGPVEDGRFISRPIGTTDMIWVVASNLLHDEFGRRKTIDQMLSSIPLWCVSRSSEYSVAAQHILRKYGANLDNVNTCNHLVALIDLVERGAGIGQLPQIMVADKLISGKLEALSDQLEDTTLNFFIVCHKDSTNPAIEWVMDEAIRHSQHALTPKKKPRRQTKSPK